MTLGGNFSFEPGDIVHILGSKGRKGLECIAEVCCSKYRIVHSGTRSTILANDYMEKTKNSMQIVQLSVQFQNNKGQENDESIFQNRLKNISVKAFWPILKDIYTFTNEFLYIYKLF